MCIECRSEEQIKVFSSIPEQFTLALSQEGDTQQASCSLSEKESELEVFTLLDKGLPSAANRKNDSDRQSSSFNPGFLSFWRYSHDIFPTP